MNGPYWSILPLKVSNGSSIHANFSWILAYRRMKAGQGDELQYHADEGKSNTSDRSSGQGTKQFIVAAVQVA